MSSFHRRRAVVLATAIGFLGFGAGCGQGSDGDDDLGSGGRGVLAGAGAGAVSEATGGSALGGSGGGAAGIGSPDGGATSGGTGGLGGGTGGTGGAGGAQSWPGWVTLCVAMRGQLCSLCAYPECVMCVYGTDEEIEQTGVTCNDTEENYRHYCRDCVASGSTCPLCREEWY